MRLVWVLERELLVNGSEGCRQFIECAFAKMDIPYLIGGYDINSEKPAQVWTNGGEWHPVNPNPMPWKTVMGIAAQSTGKSSSFSSEISIATIAEEVKKRFPNKWQGEFELDQLGVRFWDPQADNATGCQLKPDGMLCFTGTVPSMSWAQLFGREWVDSQRIVHLGKAAGEIYFDGKRYWSKINSAWLDKAREDAHLALRASGLSGVAHKRQTLSDADRVLQFIQTINRVDGAAPLINFAPGLVEYEGRRILNSSQIKALEPSEKEDVTPTDFPWIWEFISGLLAEPNRGSVDHFLAWLQRYYRSQYHYRRDLGHALFLCGPKENGKTLLAMKIIKPLVGDRATNPYDYFTGMTQFNSDILSVPLLAMNDESAPERESVKDKLISSIKSFTVNPQHVYQPKFCDRINIPWARLSPALQASPVTRRLARPRRPNRVHGGSPRGKPVLRTGRSRSGALHPALRRRSSSSIPHGSSPHRSGLPPLRLPAFSGARARLAPAAARRPREGRGKVRCVVLLSSRCGWGQPRSASVAAPPRCVLPWLTIPS